MIPWQGIKIRTASILFASALLCLSATQAQAETGSALPMNQVYRGAIHLSQSITASASTLDGAEAKIAAQAKQAGASYKITEANTNNRVHMTAELYK